MEIGRNIILGVALLVIIIVALASFEIDFKKPKTGIYEIRGSQGDHTVDLDVDSPPNEEVETFTAPLNYGMGPYSNKKYEYANTSGGAHHDWRHPPQHVPLQINSKYTPQGTPLPLNSINSSQPNFTNGPSVDGTKNTPPSMFMFSHSM